MTQADTSPTAAGSAARAVTIGLTAFLTLVDLFAAQALLPMLARAYDVSPAAMGVAVNASTFGMAVSSLAVALVSRRIERRRGIWISLAALSVPTALLAVAPNLAIFAALRVIQGIFMAAAFALTLAYLGEHFSARNSANAFAAYITGNVASNLIGRLLAAAMADHFGVQAAFYLFALLNLSGALLAYVTVAKPLPMQTTGDAGKATVADWIGRLCNPSILSCLGVGFCILFAFIGTFTYINFVLVTAPFELGMMSLGFVYLVFLPSIITTPFGGRIAKQLGTRATLWITLGVAGLGLMLILTHNLSTVVVGLALVGIGTFLAQAAATGFMSAVATFDRGVASGLYLASYFLGGLVGSVVLGQLYVSFGWPACVAGIGGALVIAALLGTKLTLSQHGIVPRHETDRNPAIVAIVQPGDARINIVRN